MESDSAKLSSPRLSRVKRSRPGYTADSKSCESHGATNQVFTQQGLTFLTETLMQHADGHSWRDMVRREILQTDTSRCSCKGRFGHPPTPLAHVTASALAPSSAALSTPDPLLSSSSSNRSLPLWLTSRVHRQRKRRPPCPGNHGASTRTQRKTSWKNHVPKRARKQAVACRQFCGWHPGNFRRKKRLPFGR